MYTRRAFALAGIMVSGCYVSISAAQRSGPAGAMYTVIEIGTLGGDASRAAAVNNRGQVVGKAKTRDGHFHAYLWEAGHTRDLGALPGYKVSAASAINDAGLIVGYSENHENRQRMDVDTMVGEKSTSRAVIWQNGRIKALSTFGYWGYAHAVNASGVIVGQADTKEARICAFVYRDGQMRSLGYPSKLSSCANGINDSGVIVGGGQLDGGAHGGGGFIYRGKMELLPGFSDYTDAKGINNRGEVVGDYYRKSENGPNNLVRRMFVWKDGKFTDLGGLRNNLNMTSSINDHGDVVGTLGDSGPKGHTKYRAFLWTHGILTDLNWHIPAGSGWHLSGASHINNQGWIVGSGEHNGKNRGFLLIPKSDPRMPGAAPRTTLGRRPRSARP